MPRSLRFPRFQPRGGLIALALLFAGAAVLRADDEMCIRCESDITLSGDFAHYKTCSLVAGAALRDAPAFAEEIAGRKFSITVPNLPAGRYTIVVGEAESEAKAAGERRFDITCGRTVIARNVDIFARAHGANRFCTIQGTVDHPADSVAGPLVVTFTASKGLAKFNKFAIRDISQSDIVELSAPELADPFSVAAQRPPLVTGPALWRDPDQPLAARVRDLIRRLSLAEKVQQLRNTTPSIPRLGIPAYDYWSEGLHGVAMAGVATVFPQAIGMAATWDQPLLHAEGDVIATEARAKFNDYAAHHDGGSKAHYGLTFWSPNVNIFRDPRWGRGQETYGEDPFLTGQLAVAYIHGLQGDDPHYVKAFACAKHFAVHSGPEPLRHVFNAVPSEEDLYDTYLPQFEAAVREGHVGGVMGAYSSLYGVPDCASAFLLTKTLRDQWGFTGYVVSDCGAIRNIHTDHKYVATAEEAAAAALKAGCDICCGGDYNALVRAVQHNLVTEADIDRALTDILTIRFRLGLFDPPERVPYSRIGIDQNDTPAHEALALKVAEESMVLLKNDGVLPLDRSRIHRIAVIGANADSVQVLVGNYRGTPARPVTILAGIKAVAGPGIAVDYVKGGPLALRADGSNRPDAAETAAAVAAANAADVVIYVGGISSWFEGEETKEANGYIGFHGGDRTAIELPAVQTDLLKTLRATGKPVVFVNCSGSAMAMPWEAEHLAAIVQAWYPGEQGGRAVAEVLFGNVNPAGRLPVTFYRSTRDLPPFEDYAMANRTYRYFHGTPLYPFGYGLSYTQFQYRHARVAVSTERGRPELAVSVTVANTGARTGDEVVQVYARPPHARESESLCAFTRVHLAAGGSQVVRLTVPATALRRWDSAAHRYVIPNGQWSIRVGASAADIRQTATVAVGHL